MKIFTLICILILGANLSAQESTHLRIHDTRKVNSLPSEYKRLARFDFKINSVIHLLNLTINPNHYSGLLTIAPWVDDSGGAVSQLAFNKDGVFQRIGYTGNPGNGVINGANHKWHTWNKIIMGDANGIIQSKLEVNGIIRAKEVKIEATGWPDFVFKSDYNLKPLSEVEQHINTHGHLPNIPSETEVAENGVEVGEMQIKLLQKIEELTLYVIAQDKEVESLRRENQEQNRLIEDLQKAMIKD